MSTNIKGLGIIFHSDSYDRIHHGLSLALAGSALGREVKLIFTYGALVYLKKNGGENSQSNRESETQEKILEKSTAKGHSETFAGLISQLKAMGGNVYTCTNSMGMLNIARNELVEEVDKSTGLTTFLSETSDYQILFI